MTPKLSRGSSDSLSADHIAATITFLLSPLISVVLSLRNHSKPWSRNVVWLFIVFFGYTFVVTGFMDSNRYSQRLIQMSSQNLVSFQDIFSLMYEKDAGYVDVLEPLVTFTVSRFTSDTRILFAVFGLIFGYFYSRNLWFLLSKVKDSIKSEAMPFLVLAALIIAMWQINGFRFWTAAHVFVFGLIQVHSGKKWRGILFTILSCFVHFSFVLAVAFTLVHFLIGNRLVWISILYFISFSLVEIDPEAVRGYSSLVPEVFQERTEGYTNEEYRRNIEKSYETANWYVTLRHTALRYTLNVLLLFLVWRKRFLILANKEALNLICYALLLAVGVNLVRGIPSMYRFQYVSDVVLCSGLFVLLQGVSGIVLPRIARYPFLLATALYVLVEVRIGFETTSVLAVFGNPLVAPFLSNDPSLIWFFK